MGNMKRWKRRRRREALTWMASLSREEWDARVAREAEISELPVTLLEHASADEEFDLAEAMHVAMTPCLYAEGMGDLPRYMRRDRRRRVATSLRPRDRRR